MKADMPLIQKTKQNKLYLAHCMCADLLYCYVVKINLFYPGIVTFDSET